MFHLFRHKNTTAQWIQQKYKCVLYRAFLSYKFSDELDVNVLGRGYKINVCGKKKAGLDKVHFLVFLKHYKILRYIIAGNVMIVYSKKDFTVNAVSYGSNTL
jgi:hypothetical protein